MAMSPEPTGFLNRAWAYPSLDYHQQTVSLYTQCMHHIRHHMHTECMHTVCKRGCPIMLQELSQQYSKSISYQGLLLNA